jgi:hypothetical protein
MAPSAAFATCHSMQEVPETPDDRLNLYSAVRSEKPRTSFQKNRVNTYGYAFIQQGNKNSAKPVKA